MLKGSRICRTGRVPAPGLENQRQRAGLFSNFHQLQSFLVSNCSSVYDCDYFISRSRGLNNDLGSYYRSITP